MAVMETKPCWQDKIQKLTVVHMCDSSNPCFLCALDCFSESKNFKMWIIDDKKLADENVELSSI